LAVIGDGSLQEGNAYEALNHAGTIGGLPLIVVLNDNGMAIGPSVGAVHGALERAKTAKRPGDLASFFAQLGYRYLGPADGHDLSSLRLLLRDARRLAGPVLVHVLTRKGRGYGEGTPEPTCHHAVPAARSRASRDASIRASSACSVFRIASSTTASAPSNWPKPA
jgi:1-deoxy-D-xylulose-5-phosphate synthase